MKKPADIATRLEQLLDEAGELTTRIALRHTTNQERRSLKLRRTKLRNEYDRLKTLKMYLETNPSEDFIRAEIKRIGAIIDKAHAEAKKAEKAHWTEITIAANLKHYEEMYDVPKLQKQLMNLHYLID